VHLRPLTEIQITNALVKIKKLDNSRAKQIAHRSEGNFNTAMKLIDQGDQISQFEALFIDWVRTAFQAKANKKSINRLMEWSEAIAKLGREKEKLFLGYSLEFFRQALLLNYGALDLVHFELLDQSFSLKKFARFIDAKNIEKICSELESAIHHIERNANGKIVFTDLSIKLTRLLHQKPV
jgi:DNA polymerase-3 subunit delta'